MGGRQQRAAALRWVAVSAAALLLAACGLGRATRSPPGPPPGGLKNVPDAVPRPEPLSKYGNPSSYVALGKRYYVMKSAEGYEARGIASWYGPDFNGKRTSSGEIYDMYQMTAAHKTLPIPCYVEVTNLENGKHAILRVNDRGPFKENRIIDLSYVAARKLGVWAKGTALVDVRAIDPAHPDRVAASPAAAAPPARPAPPPRAGGPVKFYVQVGAFFERANAERMRLRVVQVAPNVRIVPGESHGQAVYRVQIGPLTDVDVSDRIVNSLNRIGLTDHHIVLD
jgi:rare lipoprotein A